MIFCFCMGMDTFSVEATVKMVCFPSAERSSFLGSKFFPFVVDPFSKGP